MHPFFTFALTVVVCINVGHAQQSTDQFLQETFQYIYDRTTLSSTLHHTQQDFNSRKGRDLRNGRLMAQVGEICSGLQSMEAASRPNQSSPQYPTQTVMACIFLNYIKEEAPPQPLPVAEVNVFWVMAFVLCLVPGDHPQKEMRQMLEQDMRPKIAEIMQPHDFPAFLHFCAGVINSRWEEQVAWVISCSIVAKYSPILAPQQG